MADDTSYCLYTTVSDCPSSFNGNAIPSANRYTTIADLEAAIDLTTGAGYSGDSIVIEPGEYSTTHWALPQEGFLTMSGDPGKAVPKIVGTGGMATMTQPEAADPFTLSDLEIDHTGTAATALESHASATVSSVAINSTGAGLTSDRNGLSLTDATLTSTGATSPTTPMLAATGEGTRVLDHVTVNASDRVTGTVLGNAPKESADFLTSIAHGVGPKGGGAGLDVTGDINAASPVILDLSHAHLEGASYGLVADGTAVTLEVGLATSDGAPSSLYKLPPAAVVGRTGGQPYVANTTAVAGGTASVGFLLDSAPDSSAPAALGAFNNSILRGGSGTDVEITTPPASGFPATFDASGHSNLRAVTVPDGQDAMVDYTTIETDDPMFVNGTVGATQDFHLQDGSAALEFGSDVGSFTDLDDNAAPNPSGTQPDLGAYESAGTPGTPTPFPVPCDPETEDCTTTTTTDTTTTGTTTTGTTTTGTTTTGTMTTTGTTTTGATTTGTTATGAGVVPTPPPTDAPLPPALTSTGITPPPVSNVYAVSKSSASKTSGIISLTLTAPGPGTFTASAKFGSKTFGKATATAGGPGAVKLSIKPSSSATSSLKTGKTLKVTVTTAFFPVGGAPSSVTSKVSVKGRKTKKKHH